MGARNTDRVHVSEYRSKANTISDMWKYNWRIRSVCETCGVQRQENLDAMIRLRGPGLVLWDKTGVCQRVLDMGVCQGRLFFKAKPPGSSGYDFLGAPPRLRRPSYGPQSRGVGSYIAVEDIEPKAVTAARGAPPPEPAE
ncbi:hypothetical protein LJR164_004494 [Phenylobacterium sp. LjRoot164]|uniref:hypothetical protein n=1 Tax=unclassified Phenylobacterium TaxID=2640670 RepID=UPI003ECC9234